MSPLRVGRLCVSALAAALIVPALAGASTSGFKVDGRVTCAVDLPNLGSSLYCASPAIQRGRYDGRGIVRFSPDGTVRVVPSGNDVLLFIDGNGDDTARPTLRPGTVWATAGIRCQAGFGRVTCERGRGSFALSGRDLYVLRRPPLTSVGFRVGSRVTCAVRLPRQGSTLYCASPAIRQGAYDGRGVVRVAEDGTLRIVPAGSDLLRAIDGNADDTARPVLVPGARRQIAAAHCVGGPGHVACRLRGAQFTLSDRSLVVVQHYPPTIGFRLGRARSGGVTCAVWVLRGSADLYSTSPAIAEGAHDGVGIVRLRSRRGVEIVPAGSDIELAITGNLDDSPRPILQRGGRFTVSGTSCVSRGSSVTCRRGAAGFTLSERTLRTFGPR